MPSDKKSCMGNVLIRLIWFVLTVVIIIRCTNLLLNTYKNVGCLFFLFSPPCSCVPQARVDRMKEAKTEAEQIISAYRAEMEASYKSKLASVGIS